MARRHQKLGHVKADAARADDGHLLPHRFAMAQHVDIAQHLGMALPLDLRVARGHAGGHDHLVKPEQLLRLHPLPQMQGHARDLHPPFEVAQHFMKLFFARHLLGHVELAAQLSGGVKQMHLMPALGQHGGSRQARRASAHHGDTLSGVG